MTKSTKQKITKDVIKTFSERGYGCVSMRTIATDLGISQSVIYHYFDSKDTMLNEIFETTRKSLGKKRKKLPNIKNTKKLLKQRVNFQFDNAQEVIFILKYYTQFRSNFKKNKQGYVPELAYEHIKEVLEHGVKSNEFKEVDIDMQAKIITHAINGFILEYYPKIPSKKNRKKIVNEITEFIYRGIKKKGGVKNGKE